MSASSVRSRRTSASALAAVLPALLVACGGGGGGAGPRIVPTPAPATPTPSVVRPTATPAYSASPAPTATAALPALRLARVADGLDQPLFVTFAPGDPSRLFVVEQTGRIRIVRDGALLDAPFVDLSDRISCCGERGLLGLAFHPDYQRSGRFFVDFTDVDGDTEVVELARGASADVASPVTVRRLLTVAQPYANHNGGMLAFGPDGLLHVGLGDGGAAGDPQNNAQNLAVKLGKIMRIDVDAYPTPPPGNAVGGDPDVLHWGLRNPWRFSFDRATGDLYVGDVGQNRLEEIDVAPAGAGPQNFGWRVMEASQCYQPADACDTTGLTLPIAEYDHEVGCSVTGGYVYRGGAVPGLVGRYLYGDYCSNRVFSLRWSDGTTSDLIELTDELDPDGLLNGLTSFGEDAAGELYLTSQDGSVFRIEAE